MSGTETAYRCDACANLTEILAVIRRVRAEAPTPLVRQVASSLRACYAMPGTDLAYSRICLRACYPMSGTDLVYVGHATCGTEIASPSDGVH
eukprot:2649739-Rhodomonas_salina.5